MSDELVKVKVECLICGRDMGSLLVEEEMVERNPDYDECDSCVRVRHLAENGACDCDICKGGK